MKRFALFAIFFAGAALAATDVPMWQRNNGAWEAVVRVSKEEPYWTFGDFRAVTNGLVTRFFPHQEETNILWRVDYDFYSKYSGNSVGTERKAYSWRLYGYERLYPVPDHMAWTNDTETVAWQTNRLAANCAQLGGNIRYDYIAFTVVRTNVVDVTPPPHVCSGELPCRFGVPASLTVDLPYADILELLPLNYPNTVIRVRTGFDGYLILRLDGADELNLSIRRLMPEKLPYERTPRNIRVSRDDLLFGV